VDTEKISSVPETIASNTDEPAPEPLAQHVFMTQHKDELGISDAAAGDPITVQELLVSLLQSRDSSVPNLDKGVQSSVKAAIEDGSQVLLPAGSAQRTSQAEAATMPTPSNVAQQEAREAVTAVTAVQQKELKPEAALVDLKVTGAPGASTATCPAFSACCSCERASAERA
jgi:hypothetical protein